MVFGGVSACRARSRRSPTTVHLTPSSARSLLAGLPLRIVEETTDLEAARREAEETPPRHVGDRLKRLFFKNATWEVFALRDPD